MSNINIRKAITDANLKHWQVANEIGVDCSTFCRWLRTELPADKEQAILEAIEKLKK